MTLQIFLGDEYSHFKSGCAIFSDGQEEELQSYLHRGMMIDTLLLGIAKDMAFGEFLLRWRIYPGSIEIYDIDTEIEKVIWTNESNKPIRIDRYDPLAPGDTFIQLKGI